MAIPDFNPEGFLPPGVHACTMPEMEDRFGRFQRTDRRTRLYRHLEDFVRELRSARLGVALIVDGSFTMGTPDPNDIDLVLVLSPDHDFSRQLRPFEYNLISRRQVRKHYGFDLLLAAEGQPELEEYIEFFAQVRGRPELKKGLLRLEL